MLGAIGHRAVACEVRVVTNLATLRVILFEFRSLLNELDNRSTYVFNGAKT